MLNTQPKKRDFLQVGSPLFDEYGYLVLQEGWSEQLAAQIAEEEGVGPLTEEHWRVLNYVRGNFSITNGVFKIKDIASYATALMSLDCAFV